MPPSPILTLAELMQPLSDADKLDLFFRLLAGAIRGQPASSVTLDQLAATITQGFQRMSDNVNAKFDAQDAKLDQLVTSVGSLEQRVAAQDGKLTAVQTERDAAVADLATTKQALTDAQAQLAAIPQVDTTALEARLQAEADKVDAVVARLNAIDAAPVPAPAPEPAPASAPAPEPAPVPAPEPVPAPTPDTAPTGEGTAL